MYLARLGGQRIKPWKQGFVFIKFFGAEKFNEIKAVVSAPVQKQCKNYYLHV
jgi:hypothetical protein